MGKKKTKITASFKSTQDLGNQISEGRVAKQKNKKFDDIKLRYDENESQFIDPKITQRILNAAQKPVDYMKRRKFHLPTTPKLMMMTMRTRDQNSLIMKMITQSMISLMS